MIDTKQEYILCAAIWYKDFEKLLFHPINIDKGIVLCGHRHPHIINNCRSLLNKKQSEMGTYIQGFLTSFNRFVDRQEAAEIAFKNNQIPESKSTLFSEDIY